MSKPTIRAVDLVFITHGATAEVVLADARWTINEVRDRILTGLTVADLVLGKLLQLVRRPMPEIQRPRRTDPGPWQLYRKLPAFRL